jgi:hypothetical protein
MLKHHIIAEGEPLTVAKAETIDRDAAQRRREWRPALADHTALTVILGLTASHGKEDLHT